MEAVVCPKCGHSDQIASLPGIVAGGVSTSAVEGVPYQKSTSATALAIALAPPPDPMDKASMGWGAKGCAAFLVIGGLGFAFMLWVFSAGILGGQGVEALLLPAVVAVIPVSVMLGILFFLSRIRLSRARAKVPQWEAEMEVWRRSYYCYRDNLVFDPSTGETSDLSLL